MKTKGFNFQGPKPENALRKKKISRATKTTITFDPEKRKEFLTGFKKRKEERRRKAREQLKEELKKEIKNAR